MPTTPSPLVLRGSGDAVLRYADGAVILRRDGQEHHIPLAAIAAVRAEGRTLRIELPATTYEVEDVSAAGAAAFADAVGADLPEAVDPSAAVTSRAVDTAGRRLTKARAVAVAVAVAVTALVVSVGLAGGMTSGALVFCSLLFGSAGAFVAYVMMQGLYRMWRLPRHGITVTAEFSHYTNRKRVYRYTDTTGREHTYDNGPGGQRVELSYDPLDPRKAIVVESVYVRCMMGVMTLVGSGMVCAGLVGVGSGVAGAFGG
ncbi:DUF3592 domain-containing protein [Streptomyces sp. NPDC003943]